MGREAEAVEYRGRRRWNGSWGKYGGTMSFCLKFRSLKQR